MHKLNFTLCLFIYLYGALKVCLKLKYATIVVVVCALKTHPS